MRWLALLAAAMCLTSCTSIRVGEFHYLSIMQRKALDIDMDASGTMRVRYSTDSGASEQLVQALMRLQATKGL